MTDAVKFAVLGIDHRHALMLTQGLLTAGAQIAGWWTAGHPNTLDDFRALLPDVRRADDRRTLLDDPSIDVVVIAAEVADRADLAIEAMQSGKDVMSDKPGCNTLEQLERIRRTVAETGRIWSVFFSERFRIPSVAKARALIEEGAIGRVVHYNALGPQRLYLNPRPEWFFDPARTGGILVDLMPHQFDNFIYLTGAGEVTVDSATVGNVNVPDHPGFEDFGEALFGAPGLRGYARVDWCTPGALPLNPGDGRITIMGTTGQIELRKFVDVAGRPGTNHLFLVNSDRCEHIDCAEFPTEDYYALFCEDVRNRTETAVGQEHIFTVMELSIRSQKAARRLAASA
ncbi:MULTISPECIES: Gfo/Idh/MocA family protein [Chelativorans]|jgi:predicted dehydrogenase|uniref:Oxidoreductase-like protein n=1 Tax=Chelativorans sp. (strain BNC1) TaxID=266779 RepID=Q11AQ5_CHESB|nr:MULTISPECIES: Gfo/Idh/MocA family oxidoreductase [Chelativorans]